MKIVGAISKELGVKYCYTILNIMKIFLNETHLYYLHGFILHNIIKVYKEIFDELKEDQEKEEFQVY